MASASVPAVVVVFDFDRTIIDWDSDEWIITKLGAADAFQRLRPTMRWNPLMVLLPLLVLPEGRHAPSRVRFLFPGQDDGGAPRQGEDARGHPRLPQERAARHARRFRSQEGGGAGVRTTTPCRLPTDRPIFDSGNGMLLRPFAGVT